MEIMMEVDNLNQSIKEFCPEIISTSSYTSIQNQNDKMSRLIEHRIDVLSKNSKSRSGSEKS